MIALSCFSLAVVAGIALTQSRRPLAEIVVDMLFWLAIRLSAFAQASDRGLLRYREAKAELLAGPKPEYLEATNG